VPLNDSSTIGLVASTKAVLSGYANDLGLPDIEVYEEHYILCAPVFNTT
jgi:hypothetical protein